MSPCSGILKCFRPFDTLLGLYPLYWDIDSLVCNTLHVGTLSPFLMVTSKDPPVIWDVSRGPAQYAGIKPPSVNFTNLNASVLPEWHSQPLPTTDSTTGSLSRTVMIRSSCNWACQCLAPKTVSVISPVTGLIQIRSFTFSCLL